MVIGSEPVFCTVICEGALLDIPTFPKATPAGNTWILFCGGKPTPNNGIDCVPPTASSVTVRVAYRLPIACGKNVTVTLQIPRGEI